MSVGGDRNQAVVATGFTVLCLFSLNHSEQSRLHKTSREGGLVHEHEHIEGVTVAAQSGGQETEIVREDSSHGEQAS
jgi:hypothetical protein